MCEPATIATLASYGGYASAAGGVVSAIGAYQNAQAQKASYNAQAAADDVNARNADAAAARAAERGDREQQRIGMAVADTRGKQRAATAANGIELGFGTAQALENTTDYYGMQDQMTAQQNATDEEFAFRQDAANKRSNARFSRSSAKAINPWMSAGGTLLTSAGSVAEKWYARK